MTPVSLATVFVLYQVVAGQVIGKATKSPCTGVNHIHFAIRKGNGTVDPTRYVEPRFPEMPTWKQDCDDYKYVYKVGWTGSLLGLLCVCVCVYVCVCV